MIILTIHDFRSREDFNTKHQFWGYRINNPHYLILHNVTNVNNFNIIYRPTPRKKPVILDIFVIKPDNHYI